MATDKSQVKLALIKKKTLLIKKEKNLEYAGLGWRRVFHMKTNHKKTII